MESGGRGVQSGGRSGAGWDGGKRRQPLRNQGGGGEGVGIRTASPDPDSLSAFHLTSEGLPSPRAYTSYATFTWCTITAKFRECPTASANSR
jgi:hypothetical protein